MKPYKIVFISHNQPVLIGRFMLIFSRRRVDVTNFSFKKLNETEGEFTIEFNAEEWAAENLLKQVQKQIDIFEAKLILNGQ
ncbi:MAG: acetolactate synthase [Bacteroidetes bacterium]|nr:acetolactate synthase [Bacteroidota bacterium]